MNAINGKKNKDQAIVAFVPVLHKGYIDFFNCHPGDIWIFGSDLIGEYKHLMRDLRTVEPKQMAKSLFAILPDRNIDTVDPNHLKKWDYTLTLLPEDEVSHNLALRYLKDKEVEYVPVFLRWTKLISLQELEIPKNRSITTEELHRNFIKKAGNEAKKSDDWWRQIGALIVNKGKILISTHNHHLPSNFHQMANGDPRLNFDAGENQHIFTSIHAEAEAIAKAAAEGVHLKGTEIYSTTFPCPNCARLIGTAGIKKVYYSKGYSLLDAEKILEYFGVEMILVR